MTELYSTVRSMILMLILVLCMSVCYAAPQVSVKENKGIVGMENALLRLEYDTGNGTFSAISKSDGASGITGACLEIDPYVSTTQGMKREWKDQPVEDEIGKGRWLRITCAATGQPKLIQEIRMYDDKGFIVLAGGIENNTDSAVRIKEISPMMGAVVFQTPRSAAPSLTPGLTASPKTDERILNGSSGGDETKVSVTSDLQCVNNLLLTFNQGGKRKSMVVGGISYSDFIKRVGVHTSSGSDGWDVEAKCSDPVGKLVEKGSTYFPDDWYYIDFMTSSPFDALEQYGLTVRKAQNASPLIASFPIIDGGQASLPMHGGVQSINTSAGLIGELQDAARTGFTKYSPVGVRLVPDVSKEGWWDESYWQKNAHLTALYETLGKWTKGVRGLDGIPLLSLWAYPASVGFASEEFQKRVKSAWERLASDRVRGVVFESPGAAWGEKGEFGNKSITTVSAYRGMFEGAKSGLGSDCYADEGDGGGPFLDVTANVADSQAVAGRQPSAASGQPDTLDDLFAKCALRWYKTRAFYTYDVGPVDLSLMKPENGDGRRRVLTLAYMTAGKFTLARSFGKMTAAEVHDLSRIFPIHSEPQSPRPIDAFTGTTRPEMYDFAVNPKWHQLAFINSDQDHEKKLSVDLSADRASVGLGLDPKKSYYVYDFWNDKFIGKLPGGTKLEQTLRPGEARMFSIHEAEPNPQFISTNRHMMQGYVDLYNTSWSPGRRELNGVSNVVGGETYKVVLATNGYLPLNCSASGATCKIELTDLVNGLAVMSIDRPQNGVVNWSVVFGKPSGQ